MIIDRVGLVPRAEVKNLTVTAFPGATRPEDLASFEPRNKYDLVRGGNGERLAVHLSVFDFEVTIDSLRDGMAGVTNPESFLLARFPPRDRTARSHEPYERARIVGRMKGDEPHAFPDPAKY